MLKVTILPTLSSYNSKPTWKFTLLALLSYIYFKLNILFCDFSNGIVYFCEM